MSFSNSGPFLIRNGFPVPISRAEFDRATGRQATASAATPRASATSPAPKFDSAEFSRRNMLAQLERQGLLPDPAPRAAEPPAAHDPRDSRAMSRANMIAELRKQGLEPVRRL